MKDLLQLNISKKCSGRRAPRREKIPLTGLDGYLSQFIQQQGPRLEKIMNRPRSATATVTTKPSLKTVILKTRDALKAKQKELKRYELGNRPKPQRLLQTTKLRFCLTESCLD